MVEYRKTSIPNIPNNDVHFDFAVEDACEFKGYIKYQRLFRNKRENLNSYSKEIIYL